MRLIREWQASDYRVKLIFPAEEAIARVAQRVRQGGHDIPEAVVRRRFAGGKNNFDRLYAPPVDAWDLALMPPYGDRRSNRALATPF